MVFKDDKTCFQTVQYLYKMPELEEAVGSVLRALGDGNWKMGDGKRVGKGQRPGTGDVDQRTLIQHYVCMFMHFLLF